MLPARFCLRSGMERELQREGQKDRRVQTQFQQARALCQLVVNKLVADQQADKPRHTSFNLSPSLPLSLIITSLPALSVHYVLCICCLSDFTLATGRDAFPLKEIPPFLVFCVCMCVFWIFF